MTIEESYETIGEDLDCDQKDVDMQLKKAKWVVSESPDSLPRIVVEVDGEPTLMVSDRIFNGFASLIVEAVNAYLSSDHMENLEGKSLDELRAIRRALGHNVETSEREFLEMLRKRKLAASPSSNSAA